PRSFPDRSRRVAGGRGLSRRRRGRGRCLGPRGGASRATGRRSARRPAPRYERVRRRGALRDGRDNECGRFHLDARGGRASLAVDNESDVEVHREERALRRGTRGRDRVRTMPARKLGVAVTVIALGLVLEWAFYDATLGPGLTVVDFLVGCLLVISGAIASERRNGSRVGLLMTLT